MTQPYYDIFLSNPLCTFEHTSEGVRIDMPGPKFGYVYAVSNREIDNSLEYEEGDPVTIKHGFLHCLVTKAQLDQLEEDNFPFKTFDVALNRYKRNGKFPNHVFNPAGCVSRRGGKDYLHRVGADAEEELNPVVEE